MHSMQRTLPALAVLGYLSIGISASLGQAGDGPSSPLPGATTDRDIDEALRRIDAGEFQEAYQAYDRIRRLKPDEPRVKLLEGLLLMAQRHWAEALQALEDFNKSDAAKREYRGFAAVGRLYRNSRSYLYSIHPLEQAKKLAPVQDNGKPVRALICVDLAYAQLGLAKARAAAEMISEADNLAPTDPEVQRHVAQVYYEVKDLPAASKALDKARSSLQNRLASDALKTSDHRLYHECAELRLSVANAFRQANPNDPKAYYAWIEAMKQASEAQDRINLLKAREAAMQSLLKDPKQPGLQVFIASVEADVGGVDQAIERLGTVLRDTPEQPDAQALLRDLQSRRRPAPAAGPPG